MGYKRLTSAEERFEERAAIFEYDAGYPRRIAEEMAWKIAYSYQWRQELEMEFFEERSAIFEYDSHMNRADAERKSNRLVARKDWNRT